MSARSDSSQLVDFRSTDRFTLEEALDLEEVTSYAMVLLEKDQAKKRPYYGKEQAKTMVNICRKLDRICARVTKRNNKEGGHSHGRHKTDYVEQ